MKPITHTPGPWRVREGALFKEGTREVNPNLPRSVCGHCRKPAIFADGTPRHDPIAISIDGKGWGVAQLQTVNPVAEFAQHMANAHLIAAAPDLLDALAKAATILKEMSGAVTPELFKPSAEFISQIDAAIAKAKGIE